MALPVSRLVRVAVNLSPLAASRRSFGSLLICGDSNVISGLERIREFASIEEVATDFGTSAPEYLASVLYFGQSPKPQKLFIGRWLRTATAAQNIGGILSTSEQAIANFNNITDGGMVIITDGTTRTLTGLDFSAQTNLNGVATVIDTALTGATVAWNGSQFVVTSGSTGAGAYATGTIVFGGNPSALDTLVVNGKTFTYVAATPGADDILIGGDATITAANTMAKLVASEDPLVTVMTFSRVGTTITATSVLIGTAGNAYTLAETGTAITVPATLSGGAVASSITYATAGTGTDISAQLKLTSATAISLVPGYDAETPAECIVEMADFSPDWYGCMFQASTQPTDEQSLAVSAVVEALALKRIYGVTITNTNVLSALVTNDLASEMKDGGYKQSFCQYSENAYAIASLFGRMFSVNFNANRSTITLMYKQEPGVSAEDLTTAQASTLQDKRCNVFVQYVNDTNILQYGVMSGPAYIDEIHGLDWLQNAIETECYNLMYTSATKIPQTDSGVNQFVTKISQVCDSAVNNGLVAPGIWTSDAVFGQLETNQYLKAGYYIYAQPLALQSQSDREARIAPPIQVAIKLAGAIQEIDVIVDVNR